VNGFHPQLTAVSNPVGVNDPPPPSWPSYVHPARSSSNTRSSGDNVRLQRSFSSGSAQISGASTSTGTFSSAAADRNDYGPMTPAPTGSATDNAGTSKSSQINVCTATVVRKLQHHARESDRSRSKMLRKRVRREEKSQRRHLKRMRRQQQELQQQPQGQRPTSSRRASESTATDSSTSSFSFATISSSSVTGLNDSGSSDGGGSASSNKSKRSSMLSPSSSGRSKQDTNSTTSTAPAHETHFSELYADVFMASDRPQFMATLGGRLVACKSNQ
jgi:hypothetical protein